MGRKTEDAEAGLHDQTQLLPKRQVIFVFMIMSLALLVCFIDQNGIGVLLPDIARDLNATSSISWAGTSALIANTVFQVLYGRLSDLFGRKSVLVSALVLLSLSDLACSLSVNATMLYIFRGLAGVANGGITSLTMMIVSDIVTLQERGKYQGILGAMVGLGNALGPLIASGFALHTTWRGLFYLLAPLIMLTVVASQLYLPSNMPKLNLKEIVAKIDFLGLFFGAAAVILLLIPISSGGHAGTPWNSPEVIAMFVVGAICLFAFLLAEWKWARLPMVPLSMFKKASVAAMLAQSFLLGASYYGYLYFMPLYYQNVRGKSPLSSLPPRLASVANSTFAAPDLSVYSPADQVAIKSAYAAASRAVFIWCVPLVGICFILSAFIKDHGLQRKEDIEVATPHAEGDGTPRRSIEDVEKAGVPESEGGRDAAKKTGDVGEEHAVNKPDHSERASIGSEKSGKSEHSRPT
ncbi:hypothetical protein B0A55_01139 [Friedmanniomyces simplex]|uniref:Major facilitator superfamily (MFS) profile domain-containing protein n=1 Tax=Friedmanniomyces simplex TaxID=329884 RepID=A0A4U0XVE6_9PEZI|nr:hypothetical protein B0A55_01139 [Friedmanniomyces simplex]